MGKRKLDKLFQKRFSDFSEVPDEKVWQSIAASLDKKKKSRKIIPFWWKLGGAAAVLAIAFYALRPFESSSTTLPAVTEREQREDNRNSTSEDTTRTPLRNSDIEITATPSTETIEEKTSDAVTFNPSTKQKDIEDDNPKKKEAVDFKSSVQQNSLQLTENKAQKEELPKKERVALLKNNSDINTTTDQTVTTLNNDKNSAGIDVDSISTVKPVEEALITTQTDAPSLQTKTHIAAVQEKELLPKEINETDKKSIFDEIADKEMEEEAVVENKNGRWIAGPSIAPVYFNAIGEGSPINSIFISNTKSGELNLSYGLSVAYEINNRLKVRSGVHKVDYGYVTNSVEYTTTLESSLLGQIPNVDFASSARNIALASNANTDGLDALESPIPSAEDFSGQGVSQNGELTQQFGYLEVPVELEYALLDKKFGVNLIGGVSSLFLVANSISLSSGDITTQIGEANNINNVNFSTNVGVGMNYKFTEKIQFSLEPVFKYQLNTFSRTEGTFRPFTIGVYSGVNFTF